MVIPSRFRVNYHRIEILSSLSDCQSIIKIKQSVYRFSPFEVIFAHKNSEQLLIPSSYASKDVNPLTPGAFCKKNALIFFEILEIFSLDMGQISFNLLKKAFKTCQHASLSTSIRCYDVFARECAEIKICDLHL